ncbi:phage gp6-like head-tail connector protein [Aureimonas altamirensis]|uniref:head-tail connector protein n=1 Tax=Aureimonas altamirensis TaxID=370622 RepID=UPI001E52828B|nr:head-tail connector protein [Aureimonas altamirensis]UHD44917.1 phage gp6-like head-tail connector protein [Aureimonas altamirensis]
MTPLVTIEALRDRLRIDEEVSSPDLQRIAEEATAIVIDFLKRPDHGWTVETVPAQVRTAIFMVAQAIDIGEPEPLSRGVKDLLRRMRDPACA